MTQPGHRSRGNRSSRLHHQCWQYSWLVLPAGLPNATFAVRCAKKQSLQRLQSRVWALLLLGGVRSTNFGVRSFQKYTQWNPLLTRVLNAGETFKKSCNLHTCQEEANSEWLQQAEAHLQLAKVEEKEWYNSRLQNPYHHWWHQHALQLWLCTAGAFPKQSTAVRPAFFLTAARKCQIFGVACEPLGTQVNNLIDESESVGKRANATASMMDHYLANYSQKEDHLRLHADNCVGQNKNNCLIQYLLC